MRPITFDYRPICALKREQWNDIINCLSNQHVFAISTPEIEREVLLSVGWALFGERKALCIFHSCVDDTPYLVIIHIAADRGSSSSSLLLAYTRSWT